MARLELKDVINTICPWSGKPVQADSLTRYRGHVAGFCNPACRDRFECAIGQFDSAIGNLAGKAGSTR